MVNVKFAHRAALGAMFAIVAVAAHAQSVARPDWKVGDSWTVAVSVTAGVGASRHAARRRVR